MKIIQVIPYFCFGGAEILCENLTYALRDLGQEVCVVSLYDEHTPIAQRMEQSGIRIRYLDKKLGLDVSMIGKLAAIFREEKPDVVHTHLDVIKYAVPAAKLAHVRRCVHTVHTLAEKEAEGPLQKVTNQLYYSLGLSVPVALSPEVQATIVRFYHLKESKVPVIFNGIDLKRCIPKEDYSLGQQPRIVHAGRFTELKNHAGLLRAFRSLLEEFPGCCLDLLGDGELLEDTKALAKELGIEGNVRFWGSQGNVYPFLHDADMFILPSRYEGMPMTIIEAMGTGLPIAASRVGGIPDMIADGQSGLLIEPQPDQIREACRRMLRDQALRERLGHAAKAGSLRFSSETMAREYCRIYQER